MTIAQRINARIEARKTGEQGLALLDVLLGMAIFALIVVIGVQNFSTLRNRAYTTQVSSDVKQAATGIQAKMTEPNAVWANVSAAAAGANMSAAEVTALGVNLTGGNEIEVVTPGADVFVICVDRGTSGPSATFTAATSAVTTASGAC